MSSKRRVQFFDSTEGTEIEQKLQLMAVDSSFNTQPSYSANAVLHPTQLISFVEKHMHYLNNHPVIDPEQYIANLRLMTRIK